jgi:hypothetical protein
MPGKINKRPQRRLPRNFPRYCIEWNGTICKNMIYKDKFCKKHYKELEKKLIF